MRKQRTLRTRSGNVQSVASSRELDGVESDDDAEGLRDAVAQAGDAINQMIEQHAEATAKRKNKQGAQPSGGESTGRVFTPPPEVSRLPRGPSPIYRVQPDGTANAGSRRKAGGGTKKGKVKLLTPVQRRSQQAEFMRAFIDEKRRETGTADIFLGSETKTLTIGLPCPSLAFEFLVANNCLPLSVIIHLVARWGSGKSGMVAELFRWFIDAGGWGVLEEVETKFSPKWFASIIGPDYDDLVNVDKCESMDDWQSKLQTSIRLAKKRLLGTKGSPGLGRAHPFCFAIDSIAGKMSEESQARIEKDGSAGRAMPVEANSMARYLKSVSGWIDRWPFTVILVNHLKDKINAERGEATRTWSGGSLIGFQETLELEISKYGPPISTAEADGFHMAIRCFKNSLGVTGRTIHVRVLWWEEELPEGGFIQKTVFDWGWATIKLLHNIKEGKAPGVARLRALMAKHDIHIECPKVSEIENLAWTRNLGMTKNDALPWSELGNLIHADQELMRRLRLALRINELPLLQDDYLEQLSAAAAELE